MDRLIAQYTVPVGSGDTAPATGTPGQATSGNPATNTPATRLPAYAWNAIQEELMAILAAAGIVADRNNNAQVVAAIRRLVQSKAVLTDTGSANTYAATNTPPLTALPTSGFVQVVSISNANTAASTYAPDGLAAKPILGMGLAPLQGGELSAKGVASLLYMVAANVNSGNGAWILLECTGGAQPVAPASASQHAVQFGQIPGIVGMSRNASMVIPTASTSATFTADELVLESALGGLRYGLANVSDTFNLTTDMDTGTAPTSGFVALYRLLNPTTGATLRRIVNATAAAVPEIYAGAAAPSGFTASALLAVLPTTGAGQFATCKLVGRRVYTAYRSIVSTSNVAAQLVGVPVTPAAPRNSKSIVASMQILTATAPNNASFGLTSDGFGAYGNAPIYQNLAVQNRTASSFIEVVLNGPNVYYTTTIGSGTGQFDAGVVSYDF